MSRLLLGDRKRLVWPWSLLPRGLGAVAGHHGSDLPDLRRTCQLKLQLLCLKRLQSLIGPGLAPMQCLDLAAKASANMRFKELACDFAPLLQGATGHANNVNASRAI
jgi:hypothetical protein